MQVLQNMWPKLLSVLVARSMMFVEAVDLPHCNTMISVYESMHIEHVDVDSVCGPFLSPCCAAIVLLCCCANTLAIALSSSASLRSISSMSLPPFLLDVPGAAGSALSVLRRRRFDAAGSLVKSTKPEESGGRRLSAGDELE